LRFGGISMTHDVPAQAAPGDDALSGAPEPWERWETSLVLGSLAMGCVGLVLLGFLKISIMALAFPGDFP